jgi:hypothetical protein
MIHSFRLIAVLLGASLAVSPLTGLSASLQPAPATATATDETALCSSLEEEWKAAEQACTTNANLGRARALAREAQSKCKSPDTAQRKIGVSKYQSALRLCRKPGAG